MSSFRQWVLPQKQLKYPLFGEDMLEQAIFFSRAKTARFCLIAMATPAWPMSRVRQKTNAYLYLLRIWHPSSLFHGEASTIWLQQRWICVVIRDRKEISLQPRLFADSCSVPSITTNEKPITNVKSARCATNKSKDGISSLNQELRSPADTDGKRLSLHQKLPLLARRRGKETGEVPLRVRKKFRVRLTPVYETSRGPPIYDQQIVYIAM